MRGLLFACGTLMISHPALAGPQPTATEIFHLRTECGKLGKALLEEHTGEKLIGVVFTKYNEVTNRCCVMIKHIFLPIKEGKTSLGLYDGQGGGLIAYWSQDGSNIRGEIVSPPIAYDYIQKMMKDNMGEDDK